MNAVLASGLRYPRLTATGLVCVALAVLTWQGMVVTVVPMGGATAADSYPRAGMSFKPDAYVKRIWPKQVVPTVRKDAVPLPKVLAALRTDKAAALKRYAQKVASTYNLLVKFTGKVTKIDTSTPMGTLSVAVADGGKTIPVQVAIGPVILGTSLRDSLKLISFGEFLNQIQFGNVADALNTEVTTKVVTPDAAAKLMGKDVTIFGAWTYDSGNPGNVTVTPVIVEPGAGVSNG